MTEVSGGVVKAAVVARNQSGDEVLKNVRGRGPRTRTQPPGAEPGAGDDPEVAQAAEVLRMSRPELLEEARLPPASGAHRPPFAGAARARGPDARRSAGPGARSAT